MRKNEDKFTLTEVAEDYLKLVDECENLKTENARLRKKLDLAMSVIRGEPVKLKVNTLKK